MKINESINIILFYDGECGFCNSSVQFVLNHQKTNTVYFASLQSKLAQDFLTKKGITIKLDTLYLFKNNTIYSKSSAVLCVTTELKFPFNFLVSFLIIPKFLRDFIYSQISKNRHKLNNGYCVIKNHNFLT